MNKISEVIAHFDNIKKHINIVQIRYDEDEVYKIIQTEQYKSDNDILNFTCTTEGNVKVLTLHFYPKDNRWESGIEINYVDKRKYDER